MRNIRKLLLPFSFDQENYLDFYKFDVKKFAHLLKIKDEKFWNTQGQKRALQIFHDAAERVPAYKAFLKKHRISHEQIKTIKDFYQLPITDKDNYINVYPISARCWDGKIEKNNLISVSSGTTGEPIFWPRSRYQDIEAAVTHELLYTSLMDIDKFRTLLIVGFPMGVYVSGVATLLPSWLITHKNGYDVTIASVGNNKAEVLHLVKSLQSSYQQIVLVGHPFFIKDVIESGKNSKINWSKSKLKMFFCSEGFTENWRDHLIQEVDGSRDSTIFSAYGSSELLLIAYETKLSIALRKIFENNTNIRGKFIQDAQVPNLFQYNPLFRYIESVNQELIFTANSGIPLIRFNLHDKGKIFTFSKVQNELQKINLLKEKLITKSSWRLPFLTLSGRTDYTIVFYAANIYPQHITLALSEKPLISKFTGKFVMRKGYNKRMDEFLEIHIELREGIKSKTNLTKLTQDLIVRKLKEINMEYLDATIKFKKDLRPLVKIWPYQHKKYFQQGVKAKYIFAD